jgi:RNA polymerase sigma-70 factor (ECF subfamily)
MVGESDFLRLMAQVRSGDAAAAEELVRRYEPSIRRAVRLQLRDERLRRVLDSVDICQSVLASFFVRAATGQYDLDRPAQLLRLLLVMARNKLVSQARKPYVARRDGHFGPRGETERGELFASEPDPLAQAGGRDLLERVRERLSEEERGLADRRAQGQDWAFIAAEMGESPEALRKRLARALDRVTHELGLDELNHG